MSKSLISFFRLICSPRENDVKGEINIILQIILIFAKLHLLNVKLKLDCMSRECAVHRHLLACKKMIATGGFENDIGVNCHVSIKPWNSSV